MATRPDVPHPFPFHALDSDLGARGVVTQFEGAQNQRMTGHHLESILQAFEVTRDKRVVYELDNHALVKSATTVIVLD
jgi:hypothetical protein